MLVRLVYNNKKFKILNQYQFEKSAQEVTFQDITIDFTGMSLSDMPFKYQEVKLCEYDDNLENEKVLFTGFVNDVFPSQLVMKEENRELTISLLSPMKIATVRNLSLIGTFKKSVAVSRILQPLIDDGFKTEEIDVPEGQITCNFLIQSVEYCMNVICSKLGLFWYIDENKKIYVISIENLFNRSAKKIIDTNTHEKNLLQIQPSIQNIDYANVVNIKKARMYYQDSISATSDANITKTTLYPIMQLPRTLKPGDEVIFDNPIVIDKERLKQMILDAEDYNNPYYAINLLLQNSNYSSLAGVYTIGVHYIGNGQFEDQDTNNYSFSNSTGEMADLVFIRDSFFENLIIGFKWNGSSTVKVGMISSQTALRYNNVRVLNSSEINKMRGIISTTGIVEKTIDYNEKWGTQDELIEYARSLMNKNTNTINEVVLEYDIDTDLKIGDIVEINEPEFYIEGRFVITNISFMFESELQKNWIITLKNADMLSTFIDLFRPTMSQEQENAEDTIMLSEYVEEKINEIHTMVEGE